MKMTMVKFFKDNFLANNFLREFYLGDFPTIQTPKPENKYVFMVGKNVFYGTVSNVIKSKDTYFVCLKETKKDG